LIERKKAKLVIIAHDVVPIELVVWMPALCKKMGVPYCIVKGKSRRGLVVQQKKACCLAITNVLKEDVNALDQLIGNYVAMFNDSYASQMKKWGGGVLGFQSHSRIKT
jgi:large subunit ribosomal protein L7Ae